MFASTGGSPTLQPVGTKSFRSTPRLTAFQRPYQSRQQRLQRAPVAAKLRAQPVGAGYSHSAGGFLQGRQHGQCSRHGGRTSQVVHAGDPASREVNKQVPNVLWRVACALFYLVPWIDTIGLGREIYHRFPNTLLFYFLPGPSVGVYYSSQFTPLIVFFLLFLAIVKNTKLPHFVRFNCMQSIMLDIVVMLFNIVRQYFPSELRWALPLTLFDMFSWSICMSIVLYCVFFALAGKYGDVPFVSESVYIQVDASEYGA